jgi:hypothetical protein
MDIDAQTVLPWLVGALLVILVADLLARLVPRLNQFRLSRRQQAEVRSNHMGGSTWSEVNELVSKAESDLKKFRSLVEEARASKKFYDDLLPRRIEEFIRFEGEFRRHSERLDQLVTSLSELLARFPLNSINTILEELKQLVSEMQKVQTSYERKIGVKDVEQVTEEERKSRTIDDIKVSSGIPRPLGQGLKDLMGKSEALKELIINLLEAIKKTTNPDRDASCFEKAYELIKMLHNEGLLDHNAVSELAIFLGLEIKTPSLGREAETGMESVGLYELSEDEKTLVKDNLTKHKFQKDETIVAVLAPGIHSKKNPILNRKPKVVILDSAKNLRW